MKQNKDREEFMNCFMWSSKDNCWKLLPRRTPEKIWEIVVETHTQKKVEEALNNILEENHCDLDGTYDYDGIAESVIKLVEK